MVRRAVLLGVGHAHLFTLKRTAEFVSRGFELVLVAPEIFWYSGLATEWRGRRSNPMKLGLLADIHEQTEQLRKAIEVLQQQGADRSASADGGGRSLRKQVFSL